MKRLTQSPYAQAVPPAKHPDVTVWTGKNLGNDDGDGELASIRVRRGKDGRYKRPKPSDPWPLFPHLN